MPPQTRSANRKNSALCTHTLTTIRTPRNPLRTASKSTLSSLSTLSSSLTTLSLSTSSSQSDARRPPPSLPDAIDADDSEEDEDEEMPLLDELAVTSERYFTASSSSSSSSRRGGTKAASQRKVWRAPSFSNTEYLERLERLPDPHRAGQQRLQKHYRTCFVEWEMELRLGYSLVLYGYGSKHALLTKLFAHLSARGCPCLLVLGGHPTMSAHVLAQQLEQFVPPVASARASDPADVLHPVYVLVHQLDAHALRTPRARATLHALCVSSPRVRLVATVDHLRATYLLPPTSRAIVYHHVSTFEPYTQEVAHQTHLGWLPARTVTAQSICTVLRSLPRHHQRCFQVLLTQPALWTPQTRWFALCREAFLVADSVAFQSMLTEFLDHQAVLVKVKDGTWMVQVNLDEPGRATVLEHLEAMGE